MKKGFTLIELLTAIILVGIIVTASFSTYASSREKNQLNTDASRIESAFNTARTNALTGLTTNGILPKDYGLSFTLGSNIIMDFTETGDIYGSEQDNNQYNYLFDNQTDDQLLEDTILDSSVVSGVYVFVAGDDGEGTPDLWENTDINSATVSFLLPKAELRVITNLTIPTTLEDTEEAVCLELQTTRGMSRSFVIEQANSQISFDKTACIDRVLH